MTPPPASLVGILASVGVVVQDGAATRKCTCGRTISANKRQCLNCAEQAEAKVQS